MLPRDWTLMLFTVTPSADDAEKAYEPILRFVEFAEMFCVPSALFAAAVRLDETSVKAAPLAAAVDAI